jgi:hypothetical protein
MVMKVLVIFTAIILFATPCFAGHVTLGWGASPGATKYNVYVDNVKTATVTELTATVQIVNGAHDFNVTAENVWGESAKSNTVSTPALTTVPGNLVIVGTVTIQ